ncbi:hypothetical protein IQ07DRAFT_604467 [Pyrenochaeta sp. DS3sAY3a]|nr:hypothetical protein IQ07DRAFT_604467 [Pyrenochaeta sp. DS3sAY3a]
MDPLSISASVASFLVLASKVGLQVKQIADDLKDAPAELSEVRDEIESLVLLVNRLNALAKEEARATPADVNLSPERSSQATDIQATLKSCTNVMKELGQKLDTIERHLSRGKLGKMTFSLVVSELFKATSSAAEGHQDDIQDLLRNIQSKLESRTMPGGAPTFIPDIPPSNG